jgi:ParB/RepB/Spo0J family partition protein
LEITQIPTGHLVPRTFNAHSQLRDIDELAATIAYLGILQPLIVVPIESEDGGERWMINAGHRRHAAASQLGLETVPCVIAHDRDEADQLMVMIAENLPRQELTATEEAAAYEQLALLDWEPARIAKATGRTVEHVQSALALRKLPDAVQQAADAGQMDLAQAASLAEFAGDQAVIDRILKKSGDNPWGIEHAINDERHKKDRKDQTAKLKAQLTLEGVTVTGKPQGIGYEGTAMRAVDLLDANGNPVDAEQVKTDPGFAAYVDPLVSTPTAVIYCADPAAYGYKPRPGTQAASKAEREERLAAQDARKEALNAATEVRWAFLKAHYGTAKSAKPLARDALHAVVTTNLRLPGFPESDLAESLAGTRIDQLPKNAGLERINRAAVAKWIADQESNLRSAAWNSYASFEQALDYLDRLIADGYALAEVEQEVYDAVAERLALQAATEEADEEDDDEDDDESDGDFDDAEDLDTSELVPA